MRKNSSSSRLGGELVVFILQPFGGPRTFSAIWLRVMTQSQLSPKDVRKCMYSVWFGGATETAAAPDPQGN